MDGIGVGVDQRDGDRLNATGLEILQIFTQSLFIEWLDNVAMCINTLFSFARVLNSGGRFWLDHDDPTRQWTRCPRACEMQNLFEPLRGDQPHLGAFSFKDSVGGDRSAMHDVSN